jgi:hypothetical protein
MCCHAVGPIGSVSLRWNKPQYDQRWDNYMNGITKPASYPSNGKLMQQQAHWQQVACLVVYSDS